MSESTKLLSSYTLTQRSACAFSNIYAHSPEVLTAIPGTFPTDKALPFTVSIPRHEDCTTHLHSPIALAGGFETTEVVWSSDCGFSGSEGQT